eukprot:TRINITY_DN6807_c0_g2_i1.p1 TRINITY_DN6807_c0_g2~~TRINITY_DN6807_c0_g2_i1.p1  ORF type:complete len:277 (-),score=51.22 TRINITY_DN6807_c0_g2_i1:134-964(-)
MMMAPQTLTLVPWADMLNHSSSAGEESCLVFNPVSGAATLRAHRSYNTGEEVFDSYGPRLSVRELFLDYGFFDDSNQNHVLHIPAVHLGSPRGSANEALLDAVGLSPDVAEFALSSSGVDATTLAWTRAAVATQEELEAAGWGTVPPMGKSAQSAPSASPTFGKRKAKRQAAKAMARFSTPISERNEKETLERLHSATTRLLSGYDDLSGEKINDENGQSAKIISSSGNTGEGPMDFQTNVARRNWAMHQALQVVQAEILILQGALKALSTQLGQL